MFRLKPKEDASGSAIVAMMIVGCVVNLIAYAFVIVPVTLWLVVLYVKWFSWLLPDFAVRIVLGAGS